jgi:hypothetical protein
LVDSSRTPAAVAVGGPGGRALVAAGADLLGGLGLDQGLQHQREAFADDVQVAAGAQCIQQLGQGRLVEGHRGESPWCEPWQEHTELHAMAPCLATWPGALPSKSTTTWDAYKPGGYGFHNFDDDRRQRLLLLHSGVSWQTRRTARLRRRPSPAAVSRRHLAARRSRHGRGPSG